MQFANPNACKPQLMPERGDRTTALGMASSTPSKTTQNSHLYQEENSNSYLLSRAVNALVKATADQRVGSYFCKSASLQRKC